MQVRDWRRLARLALIQQATHRQIAEAIGWKSHTYVGRILRGEVRTMDPESAVRLCHFFGVAVDDFFVTRSSRNPGRNVKDAAA